jgi:hypothetical protein
VREIARLGGDVSEFVHPEVNAALKAKRLLPSEDEVVKVLGVNHVFNDY